AATFNDLADAVNRNHFFTQAVVALLIGILSALCFSHLTIPCLELQAGFTRGVGQRLNAAMITEARTVEGDGFNTSRFRLLGDTLANNAGCSDSAAIGQLFANFGLERGSADEHAIAFWRNDVGVNVQIRAVNRQTMYA